MTLYLVRHGESEGNFFERHQNDDEKLTTLGKNQAQKVARRFASVHIDKIICSPTVRTKQTAQEILSVVNAPIEYDARFKELHSPSSIQGLPHSDSRAVKVKNEIQKHKFDPDYHHSDEDNYFDFIKRVSEGLHDIEKYGDDDTILVVAHGHVLRAITGLILFGTDFSVHNFDQMIRRLITSNTGVSVAKYSPETSWQLLTYNDHAHLLE